jgi:hypothetical protein
MPMTILLFFPSVLKWGLLLNERGLTTTGHPPHFNIHVVDINISNEYNASIFWKIRRLVPTHRIYGDITQKAHKSVFQVDL